MIDIIYCRIKNMRFKFVYNLYSRVQNMNNKNIVVKIEDYKTSVICASAQDCYALVTLLIWVQSIEFQ